MNDPDGQPRLDLFGCPIRPPRRGGPVAHVPTDETRALVRSQRTQGLAIEAIAAALGMGATTLMRHYPAELYEGGQPRRVGRPQHVPSLASRLRVARLSRKGRGQNAIAETIGISVPTLRLHYRDELAR